MWSIFLYLPLTWYLEKIGVGQFGIPLPFYFVVMVNKLNSFLSFLFLNKINFVLKPSYWLKKFKSKPSVAKAYEKNEYYDNVFFEKEPIDLLPTVRLTNVSKVIKSRNEYSVRF